MTSQTLEKKEKSNKDKVVVDTSILITAVLVDGAYRKLLRKLLDAGFELPIAQEVIDEFNEVIKREKFKKYEPHFIEIFEELRKSSVLLPYATKISYEIEGSKEDEGIVNCCVENHIDYLITHDKGTLGKYNGLTVIHAQDFYSSFLAN